MYAKRWARKLAAVNRLGGTCSNCLCNDLRVLQFHHFDDNKVATVSHIRDWDEFWGEASKCSLLCANCHAESHGGNGRRTRRKSKLLYRIGQIECSRCEYSGRNLRSLHFHHKNPSTKTYTIGTYLKSKSVDELLDEADQCEILCANCHALEHVDAERVERLWSLSHEKSLSIDDAVAPKTADTKRIESLHREGFNFTQIAKTLGIDTSTVSTFIASREKQPAKNDTERAILESRAAGQSTRSIAAQLNCSRGRVKYVLKTRCR